MAKRIFQNPKNWVLFFLAWSVILSGILSNRFIQSPGILQAVQLTHLLKEKNQQLQSLNAEIQALHAEAKNLETNRFAQLREIRKELGYAASDEIIFAF